MTFPDVPLPPQDLWSARILIEQPPDPSERDARLPIEVAQTVWCTREEAHRFLHRRVPQTQIPAGAAPGSVVTGRLCPARAQVIGPPGPDAVHTLHIDLLGATFYRVSCGEAVIDCRSPAAISPNPDTQATIYPPEAHGRVALLEQGSR